MQQLEVTPVQVEPGVWRWKLLARHTFEVNGASFGIPEGFIWDGASKPWRKRAIFCLAASHWALVRPSLVHDYICDNRNRFAWEGVSSAMAAELFNLQCKEGMSKWEAYKLWKAVSMFGPQWESTK